jgi:hypothetical protein
MELTQMKTAVQEFGADGCGSNDRATGIKVCGSDKMQSGVELR